MQREMDQTKNRVNFDLIHGLILFMQHGHKFEYATF